MQGVFGLLNIAPANAKESATTANRPRRALIVAPAGSAALHQQLAASGYETLAVTVDTAPCAIGDFAPDIAIVELHGIVDVDGQNNCVALARRLRSQANAHALPLVLVWSEDEPALRKAALFVGADDYFALSTPTAEILARLDALFWRIEADRRSAPVISDRRLLIDNFLFVLDSVREDVRAGGRGTLALIYAVAGKEAAAQRQEALDPTLVEVHGFLKSNLRCVDAVAFYGPTTLLVYLPRTATPAGVATLARLRDEFLHEYPEGDIAVGLVSFPADGTDVESLIEKAEAAVSMARSASASKRVATHEAEEKTDTLSPATLPAFSYGSVLIEANKQDEGSPVHVKGVEPQATRDTQTINAVNSMSMSSAGNNIMQSGMKDATRAADEAAARERERRASGVMMPTRLLLTVSDAARMAQLNSLIRSAGYEARAAFDGQQALDLLRIERPDLLLLDYQLNGIDGLEVLRRLRKQCGGRLTLPVILLLPSGNEMAHREALELGARSVVTTPYDPVDLLDSVRTAGSPD